MQKNHIDAPNIARDGGAKNIVDAPIKPGMTRQTKGDLHPHLHGIAVDDEPNTGIIKDHERATGFHSGMTDKQVIGVANNPTGGQIFEEASRLGKPPEKE